MTTSQGSHRATREHGYHVRRRALRAGRELRSGLARAVVTACNVLRRLGQYPADYVVLRVTRPLPERDPPRRPFPLNRLPGLAARPLSLAELRRRIERITADPRVQGIVFTLDAGPVGLAQAQSLRDLISRARRAGKRTAAYLPQVETVPYYVATACDSILAAPAAAFNTLGLRLSALFLRDVLRRAGVRFEVIATSPYKAAGDVLTRADMSPEQRANLEWVLEDLYGQVVAAIGASRRLAPKRVRALLDGAPYAMDRAVELGLVDAALHEDELGVHLGTDTQPARLATWQTARRRLMLSHRPSPGQVVGVVTISGMIVEGTSRRPPPLPIPAPQIAGARSIVQALRRATRDDRVAAVILAIDSPGGVATACATIAREVARVRKTKPVVAYLGSVAASGGYYVAAPCHAIIAHAATVTGSIGTLVARPVLAELYARVGAGHVELTRGRNAGLYRGAKPWTEQQRQHVQRLVRETDEQFRQVVASGRGLDRAALDEVALGRVWTGRQAVARGLADCLGDIGTAVEYARALAGLPAGVEPPTIDMRARGPELLPEDAEPTTWLDALVTPLLRAQPLALAPWTLCIGD